MPLTFTVYRSTDTDATSGNQNSIYASSFTINGGATTSTITISDGSATDVLYGDGGGDSPTDPTQTLTSTTAPGVNTGGAIIYEGVVTFSGSDGNTYTAIIFDYNEDSSSNIDNNNSFGTNSNGLFEEGFFIAFIPNGFDPSDISGADIGAGPVPPPGVTLTRTAEVLNNAQFTFTCFTAGTLIKTPSGDVPVEYLREGNEVETFDHRHEKIRLVVSRKITSSEIDETPKFRPIHILAGALGNGLPRRDLLVSRQHRMVASSVIAERVCGTTDVLIPAIKLTELPGIFVDKDVEDVEYFHILFDQHEVIFAEGAPSESLYTGPQAILAMESEARKEVLTLFPELADRDYSPKPALPIPTAQKQKRLVARHMANNKPLLTSAF
jgi:hypothetical protein